ncbi:MAG: helix-turn-helix transcriptional regulator [Halobacteriota archaeon]
MDSEQVAFLIHDFHSRKTIISEVANFDERFISDYEHTFYCIDPVRPIVESLEVGNWFLDEKNLGRDAINHSDFYQTFLQQHGLTTVMCSSLYKDERYLAGLSFQGGKHRRKFDDRDTKMLEPLMHHLTHATRLRMRFESLSKAAAFGSLMLNSLSQAILLITDEAKLVYANRTGESWLKDASTKVKFHDQNPHKQSKVTLIHSVLFELSNRIFGKDRPLHSSAKIILDNGTRHYPLGFGLTEDHPLSTNFGQRIAIILIKENDKDRRNLEPFFKELFGLTSAEMRIVEGFNIHNDLNGIAHDLGISHETARAHLKAIFQKTDCHNQGSLRQLWTEISGVHISR